MGVKVIVTPSYQRANQYMSDNKIDRRSVRLVVSLNSAERLRGLDLKEDEVVWLGLPHSFPDVIERIVRSQIRE